MKITLEELAEHRNLFISIKTSQGELMVSGDVSDELEDWTMLMWNIMKFGFDHSDFVKYLEQGISAKHWESES